MMKNVMILLFLSTHAIHALPVAEAWHASVAQRYQSTAKPQDDFRDYETHCPERVQKLYYHNHTQQTMAFVLQKRREYCSLQQAQLSVWQVMKFLDTLVDESDPDLDLPQSYHAYQTAEALRKDGHPRWLILTGFVHDLGKFLQSFGEPQWAIVGDTFPLGCAYANQIVFAHYFKDNPDANNAVYNTMFGIYKPGCGLRNVIMSWGHDEYLYHVMRDYLPEPALYIIRYHSFYALHRDGAYEYLLDEYDRRVLPWLKLFSHYDLYSKDPDGVDVAAVQPYYHALVAEFLPDVLAW